MNEIEGAAPGRVNLIGEHTDYNGGYVLPTTIPQQTRVELRPRADRVVTARSVELGPESLATFNVGNERQQHTWIDYVQGVTWAMRDLAKPVSGFTLVVTSSVPIGKGLSSSASLEVAVARALNRAYGLELTDLDIALLCHRAETGFVGAPVGIMDHMVCSLGNREHALFLDVAMMQWEQILLPTNIDLGVVDSGFQHSHASGEYRTRRRECEEAAARLGVEWLRAISPDDLPRLEQLPEPLNRRARHVVTENARVLRAVEAIRRGDAAGLGALFLESHASMRDDFEVSTSEIDTLVAIAVRDRDVLGARLTGGGFGGSVVILCAEGTSRQATYRTLDAYRTDTRCNGRVLVPPSD